MRRTKYLLACATCGDRIEVLVKAFMPDFEAYRICSCGTARIDDYVTVRWLEYTNAPE